MQCNVAAADVEDLIRKTIVFFVFFLNKRDVKRDLQTRERCLELKSLAFNLVILFKKLLLSSALRGNHTETCAYAASYAKNEVKTD